MQVYDLLPLHPLNIHSILNAACIKCTNCQFLVMKTVIDQILVSSLIKVHSSIAFV